MSLLKLNLDPDRSTLRRFGLYGLLAFGLVGAWIRWRHSLLFFDMHAARAATVAAVLWVAGAACGILGLLAPHAVRVIYVGLTLIALPIGYVVSHAVVFVLYFGVLLPVALLHRLCGGDPLSQRARRTSGWHEKGSPPGPAWYYRQS